MAIIAISRGSFSGGRAVAEQLAARLSQPLLSREEVVAQAALDYGISERELADSLDQPPPFWQQVLGKRLAYVKCLTAVLLEHARQGDLIYHGNVGHLLLSGVPHVLRVRVIADLEQRIQAAMDQARLGREQAIAHIDRVDKARARWAQVLYGVSWDDPAQYDLVVNLARVSPATACEGIARMTEASEFKPSPASQKQLEDLALGAHIWAVMAKDPVTRSAGLEITADSGDVVITGSVGSARAAEAVARTAREVQGVKSLRCDVGVGSDWHW